MKKESLFYDTQTSVRIQKSSLRPLFFSEYSVEGEHFLIENTDY